VDKLTVESLKIGLRIEYAGKNKFVLLCDKETLIIINCIYFRLFGNSYKEILKPMLE